MKFKKLTLLTIFFLIGTLLFCQTKTGPYKINNIKAFLYYNENKSFDSKNVAGTMSENIIDNDSFSLWNVIIGEGSAEGMSEQTFVVVEIKGNPSEYIPRDITLTAMKAKKIFFKQTQSFAIFNHNGKCLVAFLLYNTGGEEITLNAEIINGLVVESKLTKLIPFAGGE
jgi:hypothetical protein